MESRVTRLVIVSFPGSENYRRKELGFLHTRYLVRRASFAGRNEDQELHDTIVDPAAARLDNKHILVSKACQDLDACFSLGCVSQCTPLRPCPT